MPTKTLPRHKFWGAGEPDCPADLKAPNGELHTMRCKVCGDGWRESRDVCLAQMASLGGGPPGDHNGAIRAALQEMVRVLREYGTFPAKVIPALLAAEAALGVGGTDAR